MFSQMQLVTQYSSRSIRQLRTMENQIRLKVRPTAFERLLLVQQKISSEIFKVHNLHSQMVIKATSIALNNERDPNMQAVAEQEHAKRSMRTKKEVKLACNLEANKLPCMLEQ